MKAPFRRKLYDEMLEWKRERKGTTALLVEGARRVGKSTLVQTFAKNEYETFILIDFNLASQQIHRLFDDISNLDLLFLTLQSEYNVSLKERKSLIIFDEVQKCPRARQAIKYLVADGRYDYIETGSLISIRKNVCDITIPSEEQRIYLNPMDFDEFLWATGQNAMPDILAQFVEKKQPFGASLRSLLRTMRLYMLVGGMPQAVNSYIESNDLSKVDAVKRDIINLYVDDFMKIDPSGKLSLMFQNIPAQLSSNVSRYQTTSVVGRTDEDRMSILLSELEQSRTVQICHNSTDPSVGLPLTKDFARYKIYCADTGLFVTLAFWDKRFTENVIYNKLLSDKLESNLGYVYENLVSQMLISAGHKLYYHTWQKDDRHYYEVDFVLSIGSKIVPIEVKSSGYIKHTSLDAFCDKYSSRISRAIVLYTKDIGHEGIVDYLPAFMAKFI